MSPDEVWAKQMSRLKTHRMEYFKNNQLKLVSKVVEKTVELKNSIAIFLEGVPGSGKTAFAKALADELGAPLHRYDCSSESNSSIMVAYDLDGIIRREAAYVKGPLWEAFDEKKPTILLVDEVDKSPRDFEAFLLRTTDEQSFRAPRGQEISAKSPVIFIFTSNGRREMSPEFLRRCMRVHLEYPTGDLLRRIVQKEYPGAHANSEQLRLLCHAVDTLNGKVAPDELPSPKELGTLLFALESAENKSDVEVLIEGFFLKNLEISELNEIISFSLSKALNKKSW